MKQSSLPLRPFFERLTLVLGAYLLFTTGHRIGGDGAIRSDSLNLLLEHGAFSAQKYSLVGPLFSSPLWLLDKVIGRPTFSLVSYNALLVIIGVFVLGRILKSSLSDSTRRRFQIILLFGSLFPGHVHDYYGEVFTVVLASVGMAGWIVSPHRFFSGSIAALALAAANAPATLLGTLFATLERTLASRRTRYLNAILFSLLLVFVENWLRRGSPLKTGYEGDHGVVTLLPYSGRPGFSYPFVFGLLSELFSLGKGILFYAPGLWLLPKFCFGRSSEDQAIRRVHTQYLLFLLGLILFYAKWWAWHGDWFWGPRFLLFASLPASLALACFLEKAHSARQRVAAVALVVVSFWIGYCGLVFQTMDLMDFCLSRNNTLEAFCWYLPEFSAWLRPFVVSVPLNRWGVVFPALSYTFALAVVLQPISAKLFSEAKIKFIGSR